MSKVLVNEENLTNIANAIKEKNGETTPFKYEETKEKIVIPKEEEEVK